MNRLQVTRAFWLKAAKLDHSPAFCYFWLFQQSWLICPLHWEDTCRSGTANQPMTGKLFSDTWCQNLRHQLPSTLGAALNVMHVSNIVLGKDLSIICDCCSPQPIYSESHSNQSQLVGTTQTHELANLNIVWVCWGHKCWGYKNWLLRKNTSLKMCRVSADYLLFVKATMAKKQLQNQIRNI